MADNIYTLEDDTSVGTRQVTDDGPGSDWIVVRDAHHTQFGNWGAFIYMFYTAPDDTIAGFNTYGGSITTHNYLTV